MVGLGVRGILVACAALAAGPVWAQAQTVAAAPAPVVDYWTGDMTVTGQMTKDASFGLNGNNLNFDFGRSDPINGTVRIKVWVPEDGVPRLQIDRCVTALRPAKAGVTFETGGGFVPDYTYTNTPVNCGLQNGEVIVKRSDTMTRTAEGIRYVYTGENKIAQPYNGKATLKGDAMLRPVFKPVPPPVNTQLAEAEQHAMSGAPAQSANAGPVPAAPRSVAYAQMGDRQTMLPGDKLDGLSLFEASGLSEEAIRSFVESYLGDKITFMPIRQQGAKSFQTGKTVTDYLVPFCARKKSWCKAPFSTIDGAWVARAGSNGISHYIYYHSDEIQSGVYCKLLQNGFDCRPPPPGFVANQRMFLTEKNTYGLINSVVPGYDSSPRRFATATPISDTNPNGKCLSYSPVDSYVDTITDTGRVVKTEHTGTTYELRNACSHTIRTVVQLGAAGGCSQTWMGIIADTLLGERQNFSLRPGGGYNVGSCRGVITKAERE